MGFKAMPWDLGGDGPVDPSFFFDVRAKTLPGEERESSGEEKEMRRRLSDSGRREEPRKVVPTQWGFRPRC